MHGHMLVFYNLYVQTCVLINRLFILDYIDGWMDGWIDRQIDKQINKSCRIELESMSNGSCIYGIIKTFNPSINEAVQRQT